MEGIQVWLKENWPLALAGAVGLIGIILYLRSQTSGNQAVTVGPTPQEVQAAEQTEQVSITSAADVRKEYFNSLEGIINSLANAEADIAKTQVQADKEAQVQNARLQIAQVNAQAAQNIATANAKSATTQAIFNDIPGTLEALNKVL